MSICQLPYRGTDPAGFDCLPAVPGDPTLKLRAIHDLIKLGWPREHIEAALNLSRATFYRRFRDLRRHNPKLQCSTLASRSLVRPTED